MEFIEFERPSASRLTVPYLVTLCTMLCLLLGCTPVEDHYAPRGRKWLGSDIIGEIVSQL